ncbi:MAG: L-rhamnose mutarotase [Brachybacterium sp.]|nr:L-rhamnose mutarotase [Brachybacterium sp.]
MVDTIALHTRIAEGCEQDYDREHRRIPDDLDTALRRAGVHSWRIWRDGRDLFHLVEVDDVAAMRRTLRDDPANRAWQHHINQFLEIPDRYDGDDEGIHRVWELPSRPPSDDVAQDGHA